MKELHVINEIIIPYDDTPFIKSKINVIKNKYFRYRIICISDYEYVEFKNNQLSVCKVS